mmetsp:Transcript_9499/g.57946  ORF Transcript_9499/g.57946 Transcript_9499/m.57946 type:complete len:267 (+) Transcript_9499:197-997(+)
MIPLLFNKLKLPQILLSFCNPLRLGRASVSSMLTSPLTISRFPRAVIFPNAPFLQITSDPFTSLSRLRPSSSKRASLNLRRSDPPMEAKLSSPFNDTSWSLLSMMTPAEARVMVSSPTKEKSASLSQMSSSPSIATMRSPRKDVKPLLEFMRNLPLHSVRLSRPSKVSRPALSSIKMSLPTLVRLSSPANDPSPLFDLMTRLPFIKTSEFNPSIELSPLFNSTCKLPPIFSRLDRPCSDTSLGLLRTTRSPLISLTFSSPRRVDKR